MKRKKLIILMCILMLCGCRQHKNSLLQRDDWNADVKEAINDLLKQDNGENAYAVFDFDNTSSVFDVEEQLAVYQLQTMAFEIEPDELPDVLRTGLSDLDGDIGSYGYCKGSYNDLIADIADAYKKLWNTYGPFCASGLNENRQQQIQEDVYWMEFAAKMRVMYDLVYDKESSTVAYPWILYWFSGMNEEEIYSLAYACCKKYSVLNTELVTWNSPKELQSRTGAVSCCWTSGISVTENIRELWKVLNDNNIDVWVCSASCTGAIRAAIDAFGLHEYCKGMLAMSNVKDENGRYLNCCDYENAYGYYAEANGLWSVMELPEKAQTQGKGKVIAIDSAIAPLYENNGPIAGFMDSTGDFNFCTEYSSLKLVVCFNRANRGVNDGGGLIAEVAQYQKNVLEYDLAKAMENSDTLYVLQGRDENSLRTFRNSEKSILYGNDDEQLYKNSDNLSQYEYFAANRMSTEEILNMFALKTSKNDSVLGFEYGFLDEYGGYHSK